MLPKPNASQARKGRRGQQLPLTAQLMCGVDKNVLAESTLESQGVCWVGFGPFLPGGQQKHEMLIGEGCEECRARKKACNLPANSF